MKEQLKLRVVFSNVCSIDRSPASMLHKTHMNANKQNVESTNKTICAIALETITYHYGLGILDESITMFCRPGCPVVPDRRAEKGLTKTFRAKKNKPRPIWYILIEHDSKFKCLTSMQTGLWHKFKTSNCS